MTCICQHKFKCFYCYKENVVVVDCHTLQAWCEECDKEALVMSSETLADLILDRVGQIRNHHPEWMELDTFGLIEFDDDLIQKIGKYQVKHNLSKRDMHRQIAEKIREMVTEIPSVKITDPDG